MSKKHNHKKRVLLLDHYDSFTYTIALYFRELGYLCDVVAFDAFLHPSDLLAWRFSHLVLSPGPNAPDDVPFSMEVVRYFVDKVPILGICLGHECIAQAFGGSIAPLPYPMHGKIRRLIYKASPLFVGLADMPVICLYHSLHVITCPKTCEVLAHDDRGVIMSIAHRLYPTFGIQFHPEAALSQGGRQILANFMKLDMKAYKKRY